MCSSSTAPAPTGQSEFVCLFVCLFGGVSKAGEMRTLPRTPLTVAEVASELANLRGLSCGFPAHACFTNELFGLMLAKCTNHLFGPMLASQTIFLDLCLLHKPSFWTYACFTNHLFGPMLALRACPLHPLFVSTELLSCIIASLCAWCVRAMWCLGGDNMQPLHLVHLGGSLQYATFTSCASWWLVTICNLYILYILVARYNVTGISLALCRRVCCGPA
jgi:hypothetical protein